ncbi:hypothetical protein D3C86_1246030 [compost metagenome]
MARHDLAGGRIVHGLGVAVVGGDDRRAALGLDGPDDAAEADVQRLDRLHRRPQVAGVAHHVGIGEVHDDDVGLGVLDPLHRHVRHLEGAHLGLEVVGRHLGAGDQDPLLAAVGLLDPAVEEEGDVRVLLGLGGTQLAHPGVGEHRREDAIERLGQEGQRQPEARVVLGHADVLDLGEVGALEGVELGIRQGAGDLAGAVGPEVEEDHRVARADAAFLGHDDRLDELVGLAAQVRALHGLAGARSAVLGHAVHEGAVGDLDPLPAVVAVHGVVAPHDGGDLAVTHGVQALLDLVEVAPARGGRRVAPVGDGLDVGLGHAEARGHLQEGVEVLLGAVDAAVGDQAHQVQATAAALGAFHGLDQHGVGEEVPVVDGLVDPNQVLVDHAARAHVGVADLRVAHLAGRQADRLARGGNGHRGVLLHEAIPVGLVGHGDRVALAVGVDAPAVEDDEGERSVFHRCSFGRFSRPRRSSSLSIRPVTMYRYRRKSALSDQSG